MNAPLTVGSLFSGIGGIDLGLERAGMESRWFVEIDPHCRNVLARHWPGLPIYGDITAIDWSGVEPVDVLAGGFPCQPVSHAGLKLAQADDRWLWPEFAEAIRALRPRYILVENVAALLGRGFDEVVGDLSALGYDAEWDCIPAAAVGAPHIRDRVWIVAYPGSIQHQGDRAAISGSTTQELLVAHTSRQRRGQGRAKPARQQGRPHAPSGSHSVGHSNESVDGAPRTGEAQARPAGRVVHAGTPPPRNDWWATEPDVGRVADGVPHRVDRLRSLGNAVVPQVVEWIGRRIVAFDAARGERVA